MIRAAQERAIRKRYKEVAPVLDEQGRRRFAAAEALALGRGGVSLMARITGLARPTIYRGISDIRNKSSAGLDALEKLEADARPRKFRTRVSWPILSGLYNQ
jgi:DNA-binding phage protein